MPPFEDQGESQTRLKGKVAAAGNRGGPTATDQRDHHRAQGRQDLGLSAGGDAGYARGSISTAQLPRFV
jgi:hypothetical protein